MSYDLRVFSQRALGVHELRELLAAAEGPGDVTTAEPATPVDPRAAAYVKRLALVVDWGAYHNWGAVQRRRLVREGERPIPHYWDHVLWVWGHDDLDKFIAGEPNQGYLGFVPVPVPGGTYGAVVDNDDVVAPSSSASLARASAAAPAGKFFSGATDVPANSPPVSVTFASCAVRPATPGLHLPVFTTTTAVEPLTSRRDACPIWCSTHGAPTRSRRDRGLH